MEFINSNFIYSIIIALIITSNMKQDQSEAKIFCNEIQKQIKSIFIQHKKNVAVRNDKSLRDLHNKNDKSQKIYAELSEVAKELKNIQKRVRECEKLRRERKQLFETKLANFGVTLGTLLRNKNIKIKINEHIERLAAKSTEVAAEVTKVLKLFQKQSTSICGKSYDYKPQVERAFVQLSELAFVWENISKFDSVTNDSVKQILIAAQYQPEDFSWMETQIVKLWPKPKEIEKVVHEKAPPSQVVEVKSELQLAHQLLFGFIRPQQIAKALDIYHKQSNKSKPDPSALNSLGSIYEQGRGVPIDTAKAFKYFMTSSRMGDAEGLYKVGKYLQKGLVNSKLLFQGQFSNRKEQMTGAVSYYEKSGAKGHLDALTDLGYIYEKGLLLQKGKDYIIEPNPQYARKYYESAKAKQFPRAYNNLGNLLIFNNNANTTNYNEHSNLQKGIKYLEKAVQMKYPKAFINLGKCYMTGTGVDLNLEKARSLFKEAASLGEIQGRLEYLRSYIGANLQEQKTMSDLIEAARMVLLQNSNNVEALYLMGLFEQKGIGIIANKQASFHYIASAARLDYPPALTRLGDYYYSGHFVEKNYDNARVLYQKAGEKGQSQALLNLALMQEKGLLPMGSTLGQAEDLYNRAQQMGNTNALLMRGLKSEGISRNEKIIRAAQQGNLKALKLINYNNTNYFLKTASNKTQQLRKISTFYVKQTNYRQGNDKI